MTPDWLLVPAAMIEALKTDVQRMEDRISKRVFAPAAEPRIVDQYHVDGKLFVTVEAPARSSTVVVASQGNRAQRRAKR